MSWVGTPKNPWYPRPSTRPLSDEQKSNLQAIPFLAEPFNTFEWKAIGFRKFVDDAVRQQAKENGDTEPYEELRFAGDWRLIPDGFYVDEENHIVYALEFVKTNDIDNDKARKYSNCFWLLDYAYYNLTVVLYYHRSRSTQIVQHLFTLDGRADEMERRGHQFPYRDAFDSLRETLPASFMADSHMHELSEVKSRERVA